MTARWARSSLLGAAVLLAAMAPGCDAKVVGQLVLIVQTDLSLPKDIDTIRIEVLAEGVPKFKNDYERIGTEDGQIKLPGSLTLLASDNPDAAVNIIVSARSGGKDGTLRIVRDVVTTVPEGRAAALPLPVHFLCDGKSEIRAGNVESECPEGQTCLAGTCKDKAVDSSDLPDYDPDKFLGDGSCFDGSRCFDEANVVDVDMKDCTVDTGSDVTIGLQTEGDGICNAVGCFVALDAGSELGWNELPNGKIQLPTAVCDQLGTGKIVNVVTAEITSSCGQKSESLPTCGSWSNAEDNPEPRTGPIALAGGQKAPASLTLFEGNIFWANAGKNGGVKGISPLGGTPAVIAKETPARDIVATEAWILWTSAETGGAGTGSVSKSESGVVTELVGGLDAPEGIATFAGRIFWTDFASSSIFQAPSTGVGKKMVAEGNYPYRIVADDRYIYWTNEGTAGTTPPDGSIARFDYIDGGDPEILAEAQPTPRAIALDVDGSGRAVALYWANFVEDGALMRLDLAGSATPVTVAGGQRFPNGIALDEGNVYWTNRGAGTVVSLARTAGPGAPPAVLATRQNAPGPIAVDDGSVFWINAGSSDQANGAIVKLAKRP